jgi:DNA repair protein RadD
MNELRPYQTEVILEFYEAARRFKRIIIVAPTGAGKTIIAAAITKAEVKRHREVLFLAHRREIIAQTAQKLRDLDVTSIHLQNAGHGFARAK